MGENFVEASERLVPPGILDHFAWKECIIGMQNSLLLNFLQELLPEPICIVWFPYSDFLFKNKMSMGRRIALEIRNALNKRKLDKVLT